MCSKFRFAAVFKENFAWTQIFGTPKIWLVYENLVFPKFSCSLCYLFARCIESLFHHPGFVFDYFSGKKISTMFHEIPGFEFSVDILGVASQISNDFLSEIKNFSF